MRRDVVLACAVGLAMAGGTATAHHSVAAMYDTHREVTISGAIVQFEFVNPHPYAVLEARRENGTERWTLEMDNRGELAEIGFTGTTLKRGDQVSVIGYPAWREMRRLYIRRLDRPFDGFQYEQVGTRPQIRSSAR